MISLFPALLSAESWTIQKCVDEALRNSWSYQESQIALEKSDVALREAVAKRGLNLSGSASHSLSDTPLAQNDPSGVENSSSIGLSASLPLYSGGSISAAIAKSRFYPTSRSTLWAHSREEWRGRERAEERREMCVES